MGPKQIATRLGVPWDSPSRAPDVRAYDIEQRGLINACLTIGHWRSAMETR